MKRKHSLLIILLFSLFVASQAQEKTVQFGIHVNPQMSWMKPNTQGYESVEWKPSFSWGFIGEFYLMENYSLNTGFNVLYLNGALSYPHLAAESSPDNETTINHEGTLTRSYKASYIELPLTMKMRTNYVGEHIRFFGQIGAGLSVLYNAKADDSFVSDAYNYEEDDIDIYNEMNVFRMALILGAGMEYHMKGSTYLQLAVTFNNGFLDVLKDRNTIDTGLENKAINNALGLSIGIMF